MPVSPSTELELRKRDGLLAMGLPTAAAILYPWVLKGFHIAVTNSGPGGITSGSRLEAALWLVLAFFLPLSCLLFALDRGPFALVTSVGPRSRRVALMGVTSPPLFVLVGVVSSLLHSPVSELVPWVTGWLLLSVGALTVPFSSRSGGELTKTRVRVIHGVSAAFIVLFVGFHLFNHAMGLFGPQTHARIMHAGRVVYRSDLGQPLLVGLLLLQVITGVWSAWRWMGRDATPMRMIQIGSGLYLGAFILTHLNSALISARLVHHVDTDWSWATSSPVGLIMSAWSIRLLPHYALGVFFVVTHLFCGLRTLLLAHGMHGGTVNRIWLAGVVSATVASAMISLGLVGFRLP